MTKQTPMNEFLNYLSLMENKSSGTISGYRQDLNLFFGYLTNGNVDSVDYELLNSVTSTSLQSFLQYCKETRNNSPRTRARKISILRHFFGYLEKQGLIDRNVASTLVAPKLDKTLPKYLTIRECKRLLKTIKYSNEVYKVRDFAIVTLFLNCAMRLSELVSLNMGDIRDDNSVRIKGKGSKERIVYLNDSSIDAIKEYLRIRPRVNSKALFISKRGDRISSKTVQHMVKKYMQRIGLYGYSVHKLRHTSATLMYQNGADILVIKEILGHESVGTTQIYTHVSNKKIRDAVRKNPLNDKKSRKSS